MPASRPLSVSGPENSGGVRGCQTLSACAAHSSELSLPTEMKELSSLAGQGHYVISPTTYLARLHGYYLLKDSVCRSSNSRYFYKQMIESVQKYGNYIWNLKYSGCNSGSWLELISVWQTMSIDG